MKLLILDANQRSALAATRSLGSKGVPVVVADETEKTLSGSSKYCSESFSYSSPCENSQEFIETLKKECIKRNINIIFPMTEITTHLLLKHRDEFKDVIIPFASFEAFEQLTDKCKLFELAQTLNVPTPQTVVALSSQLSAISSQPSVISTSPSALCSLPFPVVIKPYRSRILSNGRWIQTSVNYANSFTELQEMIDNTEYFRNYPFLIQEYIKGEGRGIFTLYENGKPITFFAHRRIREKPPSGGISVLSESIEVDKVLRDYAMRLFSEVSWHGPAMVEFKVTEEGRPYLMEVNARFWGSLQLAIDAGVDFPYLLYQMAKGEPIQRVNSYKIGIKNRWLLGDLDYIYLTFKNHVGFTSKIYSLIKFLNFLDKNTNFEVNRWSDLRPFLFELKRYFWNK